MTFLVQKCVAKHIIFTPKYREFHQNLKSFAMIVLGSLVQIVFCYLLFQISDVSFYLIIALCVVMFIYMLQDAMKVADIKVRFMQIIGVLLIIEAIVYFDL